MSTALRLTLAEYDSMVRVGAFDAIPRKIELIQGVITEMNPAGPIHDDLVTYLTNWSARNTDSKQTLVTSQTGLDLPEQESRPEPDLMWLRSARYAAAHPRAADVQLAIEVSYSTLANDLEVKGRLYAEAGIMEYWIVDAQSRCIHVYRDPQDGPYQTRSVVTGDNTLSPQINPNATLKLVELFVA